MIQFYRKKLRSGFSQLCTMKLYCEGLDIADAVLKVVKATSSKTTNPILEGIKITAKNNKLTLVATDGELAIEQTINADVKIEGEIVAPGRLFSDFVKKISNEQIELSLDENNRLKISYTDSEVFLQCLGAEEFPTIPQISGEQYVELKQQDLKDLIEKTIFSVALDNNRPVLRGCLFEIENNRLISVALDGYRLATSSKQIVSTTEDFSVVIPGRSLNEISKLITEEQETIKIFAQKNYVMVEVKGTKIISRILGTKNDYVNYRQILPSVSNTEIIVPKSQLEDSLERVAIVTRTNVNNLVSLNIRENLMTLSAKSDVGNVTENITVSLKGDEIKIGFDNFFIRECLRAIKDEYIKIKFCGEINPCVIVPNEGDEYLFLILPLKA